MRVVEAASLVAPLLGLKRFAQQRRARLSSTTPDARASRVSHSVARASITDNESVCVLALIRRKLPSLRVVNSLAAASLYFLSAWYRSALPPRCISSQMARGRGTILR